VIGGVAADGVRSGDVAALVVHGPDLRALLYLLVLLDPLREEAQAADVVVELRVEARVALEGEYRRRHHGRVGAGEVREDRVLPSRPERPQPRVRDGAVRDR